MKRDYDDLYKDRNGSASWVDGISPEAQTWLTGLAEHMRGKAKQPVWARVHEAFSELFPEDAPKAPSTIAAVVRKRADG